MTNKIIFNLENLKGGTLNKYINAERRNKFIASKLKKELTEYAQTETSKARNKGVKFNYPCKLVFKWHLPNKRIDLDNWAFIKKFILDGMQKSANFMENDNLNYIQGFEDVLIETASKSPHVEVECIEL